MWMVTLRGAVVETACGTGTVGSGRARWRKEPWSAMAKKVEGWIEGWLIWSWWWGVGGEEEVDGEVDG